MKVIEKKNSLVIIGNEHNPTVFLGDFLTKAKIIDTVDDIDKERSVITPGFGHLLVKKGPSIKIQPDKIIIEDSFTKKPFIVGEKYCRNLPFIPFSAVGINLSYEVIDFDLNKVVQNSKLNNYNGIKSVTISFEHSKGVCNLSISSIEKDAIKSRFDFNFHYDVDGKLSTLGKISESISFLEEWESNKKQAKIVLKEITGVT